MFLAQQQTVSQQMELMRSQTESAIGRLAEQRPPQSFRIGEESELRREIRSLIDPKILERYRIHFDHLDTAKTGRIPMVSGATSADRSCEHVRSIH